MGILDGISGHLLKPLSEATGSLMDPIDITHPDVYLKIDLNEDGTRFILHFVLLADIPDDGKKHSAIVLHDGTQKTTHDWRRVPPQYIEALTSRLPECTNLESGDQYFYFAEITDVTCLILHHAWPKERLIFTEDARNAYAEVLLNFIKQNKSMQIVADYKEKGIVPAMPEDFIEHPLLPLSDYQKVGFMASLFQPSYALFCEQGTGKTAIAINRIAYEGMVKKRDTGLMYRALIIGPKPVRVNWHEEFQRFATTAGKVAYVKGGNGNKQQIIVDNNTSEDDCNWAATIIGIDSVFGLWDFVKIIPWDLIVYDESHKSKSGSSKRFKFFSKFSSAHHIKQRMIMTGTPIANTMMDLWAQFELTGKGQSGFNKYENYRKFYGKFKVVEQPGKKSVTTLTGLKNLPVIQERLARMSYSITREEAKLKLPPKVYDLAGVDMTKKQALIYKNLAEKLIHEFEDMMDSGIKVSAEHCLTKLLRLAQITSGFVKYDTIVDPITQKKFGGNCEQLDIINPKIEYVLEEIMDEERDPLGKMIIWAHFREDLRALSEKLAELNIMHVGYDTNINKKYRVGDARAAEEIFNGVIDCKVLLANPASAGTGQNFLGYDKRDPKASETYCNREIYFSCDWSMVNRSQSEDRAVRRDARAPSVRITDLIIPGTIDQEIRRRVKNKKRMALEITDVKEILKGLVNGF